MTVRHSTLNTRRPALVAALSAALLVGGLLAATPAAAGPAPSPSGSSTASPGAPAPSGPAPQPQARTAPGSRAHHPAVCTRGTDGRPVDCPQAVPRAKMPSGAKNTTTLAQPVTDLAALVDTRTWTTGGGNTFPGADVPFGMTQWSPDTMPNRSAGGGYSFGDTSLTGYSLTHVSGPGCGAAGDVPILPMTGALPSGDPNDVTTAFSNDGEIAQAGYYSAHSNQPDTITSEFTATAHTAMGRFTFPATTQADVLVKLMDSQNGDWGETARVVNDHEIVGSDTSGHFCGEQVNDGQKQEYTVHFDLVFDHPFTASQILTQNGDPSAVFLTFDTTAAQTVQAKVATSYVSDANAQLDVQTENPGWDFGAVKTAAQNEWNRLLGEIQIAGGSYAQTQEFYSALYKDFMQPNISSDVNGQYMGADMAVHTVSGGQHDQYGTFSGWDIYHSLSQLQAMLDPEAAGDQAQSLVNYYEQDQILQQWGYLNLNNYVMVGDPAQSIIADYYAFGAHNFNTSQALADMLKQATTVNDVRPGEALEQKYGYLPEDGRYGCCNAHGQVSTLEEYDSNDLALAMFASALGDHQNAAMLQERANNWQNVFNPGNGLLTPRNADGSFIPGVTGTTTDRYVEGDAYEYLWNTPNNYAALFNLLGGKAKVAPMLRKYLSKPNGFGMYAQLTNEFGFGEQYALNYAGDPAGTQQAVANIRNTMYPPGPSLDNNDDLGANSSAFVWEMLGMYPENSGSDNLVFNSPGFPHAQITPPHGRTITINAPAASADTYYVQNLKLNGSPYQKLYVSYSTLARGAQLDWKLGTTPSTWGTAPQDAPPSYGAGTEPVVGYLSDPQVTVAPGGTATVTLGAQNATTRPQQVIASVTAPDSLTVSPTSGTLRVPPAGSGTMTLTVHADASAAQTFYSVPIALSDGDAVLPEVTLTVLVAQPGSLLAAFDNRGISDDTAVAAGNFDGGGRSYSAQALAAAGLTAGQPVTAGGISYGWPLPAPGYPDNAIAAGQAITLDAPSGTAQVGVLGAASNGPSQGIATLTYADGSTDRYWLGLSDWTLNGGSAHPSYGNLVAARTTYRNCAGCSGGRDSVDTDIFATSLPADPAKTLTSLTLPSGTTRGQLHVFAIGTSTSASSGPVITKVTPATAGAGDTVTISGSGFGAARGNGYVAFSDRGTNWGAPDNGASLSVTSWSDTAITFTVPTPSGPGGAWRVWPGTPAAVTVVNDAGQVSDSAVEQITPTSDPADYYDNVGISADADETCANLDGVGFSLSADALADAGVHPGGAVTAGGVGFTWPDVQPCTADNMLAAGQTILLPAHPGASTLGLLGTSTNGDSSGTATVTYTDGTSTSAPVTFTDWAGSATPPEVLAVATAYRNSTDGTSQALPVNVFEVNIPLDAGKTAASLTLPSVGYQVGSGRNGMHVFAIGES
ncbi:GH92 family glycosyl hydrolase [Jatrophihabitans cynanchi]|uniref:GH92 family glycosyl hydrolase n=1 Tax=Jatrophihabitans cynanchi TaxID=2944128 RepID=A0ABY7K2K7_9ACTN|nr:GH92 family glycosyl hydrolase [Jatrophihabitans sp. SB3-54]WAX58230.1 GH92 family glycosyl hydrolase [Jatrophihabitans sp. SB3-54]